MSVTIPHAAYAAMLPIWETYRSAYIGEEAVKGAMDVLRTARGSTLPGMRYLPRPAGMRRAIDYEAYRDRPSWVGATERAVHGIVGSIFRHEPAFAVPSVLEAQLLDVTQTGVPLHTFAEETVSEDLLMGREGILVDYPQADIDPVDGRLMPPVEARPYWIQYAAEEIINWRHLRTQGKTILSLVVLKETVPVVQGAWGTDDFFVIEEQIQYRVLRLNERGQYEVSVWLEDSRQGRGPVRRATLSQLYVPLRQGQPLDFIPFTFVNPFSTQALIQKSLLAPLIYRNFLCWRHSADKEHALHLTAMPTLYVAANVDTPPELYVGGSQALFFPDNQAKVGIVEFHGQGLQPHENAIKEDLEMMAMFGASILQGTPKTQETATSVQWRMSGSDSPVQRLVRTCSEALTWALQVHAWWSGASDDINDPSIHFSLNTDLLPNRMEPQMLTALMQALLNNTISYSTFYYNLQQGEIARPLVDVEEEEALIEIQKEQQPLAPAPTGALPPGRNGAVRTSA